MSRLQAPYLVLEEQVCPRCGGIVRNKRTRFTCPHCGVENRPKRNSYGKRSYTISYREIQDDRLRLRVLREDEFAAERPKTRADCVDGPRPCHWLSCRYHLALEVTQAGGLKVRFPDRALEDMPHTCVLDVTDKGPLSSDYVGYVLNLTHTRVEQIEKNAMESLRSSPLLDEDDL